MKPRILVAGLGITGRDLVRKLAPGWTVVGVDLDPRAVELARSLVGGAPDSEARLEAGDATSALVLRRTALDGMQAAVATAGCDEVNLEFLRLARAELGIENRSALMYDPANEARYRQEGIDLVSQDRACASILETRVQGGHKVAAGIGLGQGEIMEVEVLPGSPVVGRTLAELKPRRWLVGAVYRDGALIVPHGETVLEVADRVLIVGDPDLLPSIATLIRAGESEFPLQYGSCVVALCGARLAEAYGELAYLVENTKADRLELVACDSDAHRLKELLDRCEGDGLPCQSCCLGHDRFETLFLEEARRDVGVLVLPAEPPTLRERLGLGRGRLERTLRQVSSPVLVPRGSFPYRRVLLAVADLPFPTAAAQLAIDVVRVLGAELHLCIVQQPDIVEGPALRAEMEARRREIERLAGMYQVRPHTAVLSGNPIREVLRTAGDFDLLVVPYPRERKASLTRPDVALHLIRRATRSVLVMPC